MLSFESKIGGFSLHFKDVFIPHREKYSFIAIETNRVFKTERGAIRYARAYLKRQRKKYRQMLIENQTNGKRIKRSRGK